jgi:DME family drug/metabolite transporter
MMFFHGLVATPLLFALVPAQEYALVSKSALGVVMIGALGPGALGGLLFVWGLRRIAASHASVLTLLEPFVAVLLAAAIMGERVGLISLVGGMLILGGALIVVTGAVPGTTTTAGDVPPDGVDSAA